MAAVAVIALSDGAETVSALSNADSAKTSHHQPFYSANAHSPYYEVDTRTTELFNFDPNTADSTTLLRLGLQPWQVRNIYKYRAAGGVYRRPLDFARLYGLTRKQYLALEPYIHISADYQSAASLYQPELRPVTDTVHHVKYKLSAGESIDLLPAKLQTIAVGWAVSTPCCNCSKLRIFHSKLFRFSRCRVRFIS